MLLPKLDNWYMDIKHLILLSFIFETYIIKVFNKLKKFFNQISEDSIGLWSNHNAVVLIINNKANLKSWCLKIKKYIE